MSHSPLARAPETISRRALLGSAAVSALGLIGASCPTGGVMFPQIRAFVPGAPGGQARWQGTATPTKFLHAVVDNVQPSGNVEVSVLVSRHRPWAGSPDVRQFVVPRDPLLLGESPNTTTRRFTFRPPHPEDYKDTQLVFFQWFVDALQPNGDRLLLAQSPQRSFRIGGFTAAQTVQALQAAQTSIVARFDGPATPEQHGLPTHLHRCLRGMGMAFARYGQPLTGPLNLFEPQLLLYVTREDASWRLMGWAYGREHTGLATHPIVSPIPWEAWFVHEAGWHPADGGFTPTPPASDTPRGSQAAAAPLVPVGPSGVWHPRIWDLHVFRRDGGVPVVGIEDPAVARGCEDWDPSWFFLAPDVDVRPRA
jgi:hypothetical protein